MCHPAKKLLQIFNQVQEFNSVRERFCLSKKDNVQSFLRAFTCPIWSFKKNGPALKDQVKSGSRSFLVDSWRLYIARLYKPFCVLHLHEIWNAPQPAREIEQPLTLYFKSCYSPLSKWFFDSCVSWSYVQQWLQFLEIEIQYPVHDTSNRWVKYIQYPSNFDSNQRSLCRKLCR